MERTASTIDNFVVKLNGYMGRNYSIPAKLPSKGAELLRGAALDHAVEAQQRLDDTIEFMSKYINSELDQKTPEERDRFISMVVPVLEECKKALQSISSNVKRNLDDLNKEV